MMIENNVNIPQQDFKNQVSNEIQQQDFKDQVSNEIQHEKKSKKFRISAKRMHLIYPKVAPELSSEIVRDLIQKKIKFSKYLISKENDKDKGIQIHVLLESDKKFSVKNRNSISIEFLGKNYDGNYQPVKKLSETIAYIGKQNNVITNFEKLVLEKSMSIQQANIAFSQGEKNAKNELVDKYTNSTLRNLSIFNKILKHQIQVQQGDAYNGQEKQHDLQEDEHLFLSFWENLEKVQMRAPQELLPKPLNPNDLPVKYQDFDLSQDVKDRIEQWLQVNGQPTMIIVGPTAVGKTLLANALLAKLQAIVLEINDFQELDRLSKHTGILYDNPCFGKMTQAQLLSIFQTDQKKRAFRVLGNSILIPGGITQIITMSYQALSAFKEKFCKQEFARRMVIIDLKECAVNINVNLDLQMHAKIFNNKDNIDANLKILNSL